MTGESPPQEQLQAYLSAHLGRPDIDVREVTQVPGGLSKVTVKVRALIGGRPFAVVIRQAPPGRPGTSLPAEFDVLRWAWRHGLPVPEPLWIEMDPDVLGGPFLVTRLAAGANVGTVWGSTTATGPDLALHLAQTVAGLHQTPATDVGMCPVAPMCDEGDVRLAIAEQAQKLRAVVPEPAPEIVALFDWLEGSIPPSLERSVLVHGDIGFHNVLVEGGRIARCSRLGAVPPRVAHRGPGVHPSHRGANRRMGQLPSHLRCRRRAPAG